MRVEPWEFKRCCFCLPLRYGLLISGYLKLISSMLMMLSFIGQQVMTVTALQRVQFDANTYRHLMIYFAILGITCVLLLADIALTILFLIGCHKKRVKLLRVYNYYSIGMLILYVLMYLVFIGYQMYQIMPYTDLIYAYLLLRGIIVAGLVNICFQVYMIFINKSEILKLESNCKFRFQNYAIEAQCTMEEADSAINGNSIEKSEPAEQNEAINGNEENHYVENKTNGNYVQLNN